MKKLLILSTVVMTMLASPAMASNIATDGMCPTNRIYLIVSSFSSLMAMDKEVETSKAFVREHKKILARLFEKDMALSDLEWWGKFGEDNVCYIFYKNQE